MEAILRTLSMTAIGSFGAQPQQRMWGGKRNSRTRLSCGPEIETWPGFEPTMSSKKNGQQKLAAHEFEA